MSKVFGYLQKIGKSLMLPVAVLPAAAILLGIGYWINSTAWGESNVIAKFLFFSGQAIIDHMAILFAAGVSYGLSKDKDGSSAISGVIAFLVFMSLLNTEAVSQLFNINIEDVDPSFEKINNQFVGIIAGIIGGHFYNKFSKVELPAMLSFFSGKRLVPIATSFFAMFISLIFLFVWPFVFGLLTDFGVFISNLGIFGAGLYGFFNRLLIPLGLHHALNSVFWFDGFGIADLQKFFGAPGGVIGQTGRYMSGFFPIMMFGLPGAALAIVHTSKPEHKTKIKSIMLSAAFASFLTGITEPIEFAFLFVAPILFVCHAFLTGLSMMITASIPALSGFGFSAGLIDLILSFQNPYALNAWMLPIIGIVFGVIYYVLFKFLILKFNLLTPGRSDDLIMDPIENLQIRHLQSAQNYLLGLGGKSNIVEFDHCITRLRLTVKNASLVNESILKSSGAVAVLKQNNHIQVIIGPDVQFIASKMQTLL